MSEKIGGFEGRFDIQRGGEDLRGDEVAGVKMPRDSKDPTCRFYLREIERAGTAPAVEKFLNEKLARPAKSYASVEEFYRDNPEYEEGLDALSDSEKAAIKAYSGYKFAWINSVARGVWDYEKLGRKTPELEEEIKGTTRRIIGALEEAPGAAEDFMVYRGTGLEAFRAYGVNSLSELSQMEGQFMLEQGFTSTALSREQNFAERAVDGFWTRGAEVEVRFRVPKEARRWVALFSEELSFSPSQTEVLIDHDALSFVSHVSVEDGRAVMEAILVPPEVYEPERGLSG